MGTLMDKLNATNATKEQIRQAIERKKVSVPTNTPLKDYPSKIDGIYPDALFLAPFNMLKNTPYRINNRDLRNGQGCYGNGVFVYTAINSRFGGEYVHYVTVNEETGEAKWGNLSGENQHFVNPIYANGLFIAFGYLTSNGTIRCYRSTNGVNWSFSDVKNISGLGEIVNVIHDGKQFVAIGNDWDKTNYIIKSTDGIKWTLGCKGGGKIHPCIGFIKKTGKYILATKDAASLWYSSTIDNWSWSSASINDTTSVSFNEYSRFICLDDAAFITSSTDAGRTLSTTDGVNWNSRLLYNSDELRFAVKMQNEYVAFTYKFTRDNWLSKEYHHVYRSTDVNTLFDYGKHRDLGDYGYSNLCYSDGKLIDYYMSYENSGGHWDDYSTLSLNVSYDGYAFYSDYTKKIIDVNDKDVSNNVMQALRGISTLSLQAAYQAGVNSI